MQCGMGAGRKIRTMKVDGKSPDFEKGYISARNLPKNDLGGAIFGCNNSTMPECLSKQLFGLPSFHFSYVRNIEPGLPLFLFNYDDRKIHGIFESASHGQLNIDPNAWCDGGAERTAFPAQVRIQIKTECQPLLEEDYRCVIGKNYYRSNSSHRFWFELDHAQTRRLILLFKPFLSSHEPAIDPSSQTNHLPPLPVSKWKQKKNVTAATPRNKDFKDQVSDLEEYAEGEVHVNMDQQPINEDENKNSSLKLQRSPVNCKSNLSSNVIENDTSSCVPEDLLDHYGQVLDASCTLAVKDADFIADVCYHGNAIASSRSLDNSMNEEHQIALNCCDGKANRNSGKALMESCSMDNQEKDLLAANVSHESVELLETIRELKMRTTTLEKQQVEFNGEIQHLRHLLRNAGQKIQLLDTRLRDLQSNIGSSVLLADCTGKLVEQYLGSYDVIYLIGGFNGSERLSALESFSPSLDILTSLKSMSSARSYASVVALDGFLYAVGGGDGVSWYDSVERYDRRNDEWTSCPKMIHEKGSLAGATLNGKIYVIGGSDGFKCFPDVEMYDPALGRWISSPSMLHKANMEAIMRSRELTESRMIQALREELAAAERRVEEERVAHNSTKMAAAEREVELEHRAVEASNALARIQRTADESTSRAAELEHKVALLEVEYAYLIQEIQELESCNLRGQKKVAEENSQILQIQAWQEEVECARQCQRGAENKLSSMEAELQKMRVEMAGMKRDAEHCSLQEHIELEKRYRELTDLLYHKQTQLEAMASEKAAAEFHLEKLKRLHEAQAEAERSRASRRSSSLWEEDTDIKALEPLPLHHRHVAVASIQLQRAAKLLDSGTVRATRFLWRYPVARVLLLCYLVFVHLFLMYLLHRLQAQAEDFSPENLQRLWG